MSRLVSPVTNSRGRRIVPMSNLATMSQSPKTKSDKQFQLVLKNEKVPNNHKMQSYVLQSLANTKLNE